MTTEPSLTPDEIRKADNRAKRAIYREKNREKINARAAKWYRDHTDYYREYYKNRKRHTEESRQKQKERYYVSKQEVIAQLGGKCAICGSTEKLEIDHINPEDKSFDVTTQVSHNKGLVAEEIKKCQLLCHPCHLEKTIRERGQKIARGIHGSLSSYRYCKCPFCTEVHSKYCLEWKARAKRNRKRRSHRRRLKGE
jgi:hypothetical protein